MALHMGHHMRCPYEKPYVEIEIEIKIYIEIEIEIELESFEEKEIVAKTVAVAALKYADLLPFRGTDYIFELEKFADLEGKTGSYILYSTIRMKSLLKKAEGLKQEQMHLINKLFNISILKGL